MLKNLFYIILSGVLSLGLIPAKADDVDGRWWGRQDEAGKIAYVRGFFDGTSYSMVIMSKESLNAMIDPKTGKYSSTRAEPIKSASTATLQTLQDQIKLITVGQVVDGLDATYSDYKNQGIPVSDTVHIVLLAIKGASESEISRLLEMSRRRVGK